MEVTLPSLILHSEPHFGHRDAWVGGGGGGGGELAKEVDFVFMFCYFVQAHFVMFSGLLGPLSIKLLYFTAYFSKFGPVFAIKLFVVLPNLWFEKLKLCPILLMLDWFHA